MITENAKLFVLCILNLAILGIWLYLIILAWFSPDKMTPPLNFNDIGLANLELSISLIILPIFMIFLIFKIVELITEYKIEFNEKR